MTKTVLIIDRQAIARRLLRFALELQGYRVVEAGDLFGALDALAGCQPHLLVIGIESIEMDIPELVLAARRQLALNDLPVLLLGEEQCRERADLRLIDRCAWLNKPFRIGELDSLVEGLLGSVPLPESGFGSWAGGVPRQGAGHV